MNNMEQPTSILFCCDHNSIRSPIAEGLMKKHFGTSIYVQSVGVESEKEIDGFTIAVCKEIGVELGRHQVRNFDEMEALGDHMIEFDMVVALSKASYKKATKLINSVKPKVEYWQVGDPIFNSERREDKLIIYRAIRDQIDNLISTKFNNK